MTSRREVGASATEYVGIAVCAALLVAGVSLAIAPAQVENVVRHAICMVVHLGDVGQCEVADPKIPTQPCAVSSDGVNGSAGVSVAVQVNGEVTVVTQQMSDGTYRVTKSQSVGAGVTAGVGYKANVTVNDSRYGADIRAEATAGGQVGSSETYVVSSKEAAESLSNQLVFEAAANQAAGPVAGPVLGLAYGKLTGAPARTPSSITVSGGVAASAAVSDDVLVLGAKAKVGVGTVLGYTTNKDGSTTIAYGVNGTAEVTGSALQKSVKAGGTWSAILTEDRDSHGNLVGASIIQTAPTSDGQQITTYYLPVRTDADRAAVQQAEWDPTAPWIAFPEYVKEHGQASSVEYKDDGTKVGAEFSVQELAKVGFKAAGGTINSKIKEAKYWDGTSWQPWTGCAR